MEISKLVLFEVHEGWVCCGRAAVGGGVEDESAGIRDRIDVDGNYWYVAEGRRADASTSSDIGDESRV